MAVDIVTFGCRLNAYESEVIRREAEGAGLSDTIVINTCAVTDEAVAQARQAIRKLRRERPGARIIVTGCAAQTEPRCSPTWPRSIASSAMTTRCREAWRDARAAFDTRVARAKRSRSDDIMAVRRWRRI